MQQVALLGYTAFDLKVMQSIHGLLGLANVTDRLKAANLVGKHAAYTALLNPSEELPAALSSNSKSLDFSTLVFVLSTEDNVLIMDLVSDGWMLNQLEIGLWVMSMTLRGTRDFVITRSKLNTDPNLLDVSNQLYKIMCKIGLKACFTQKIIPYGEGFYLV